MAVKRLQARGLPLVSIQQELAGATDTQLAGVAHLPAGVAAEPVPEAAAAAAPGGEGLAGNGRADSAPAAAARPEALAARPATAVRPPVPAARQAPVVPRPARAKATRARFWREQPAALTAAADADANTAADPADPAGPGRDQAGTARAPTLRGVRLGDGATLLLEPGRELGTEDVQAILDAARPLLATLRDRGLGARSPGQGPEARPAGGTEPRREHP